MNNSKQSQEKNKTAIRFDIQFLRAFAVISVIAYHYKISGFSGGFLGVDIFFVISGYLIFNQIKKADLNHTFSLRYFAESRLRRIYPGLIFASIFTLALGWFFDLPRYYIASVRDSLAALFFVSNHAFNSIGYFDIGSEIRPMLHTWSLSIEAQFYVFIALGYALIHKFSRKPTLNFFLILTLVLSFTIACYFAYLSPRDGFYKFPARIWEFLLGASLVIYSKKSQQTSNSYLCLLGFLTLILGVVFLDKYIKWPSIFTCGVLIGVFIFLYYPKSKGVESAISFAPFQYIGNISYSLYLFHWPIWVFANKYFYEGINTFVKCELLFLTLILSSFSYYFIEKPFRNKKKITISLFVSSLLISLVCAIIFSLIIIKNKGLSSRFPDYIARASSHHADPTPRKECFRSKLGQKKSNELFCTFGDSDNENDASVILWGDSHANQYLTPIAEATKDLSRTGLIATMSGCIASLEKDSFENKNIFNQTTSTNQESIYCRGFNANVREYIKTHQNIKTVILGQRWLDTDEAIDRTLNVIQFLEHENRKVILVGPIPGSKDDVEIWWANEQIKAHRPIETLYLSNEQDAVHNKILNKIQFTLNQKIDLKNIVMINPIPKLCEATSCFAVKDGQAIFRDRTHLTEFYARKLKPDFISAIHKTD